MSDKSARVLVITPIFFAASALLMAMKHGNPLFFVILFAIVDGIANLFYTAHKIPTSRGEYLELSQWNQWIKFAHLSADIIVVCFHLYFYAQDGTVMAFYPIMECIYLIPRIFIQFSTALTLAKLADAVGSVDQRKIPLYPLQLLLHLIPVVDAGSAFLVNRHLNKIK